MKATGIHLTARKKQMNWVRLLPALLLAPTLMLPLLASPPANVPYPTDYRKWVHVKTVVVGPKSPGFANSGGIHHVYANEKAMEGLRTGTFPDGAVFVFDLLEATEKDGVTSEGRRKRIDMMLKDAAQFSATGGWGFERFAGDSETERPLTEEIRQQCFSCHEQRKEHGFVFSEFRK